MAHGSIARVWFGLVGAPRLERVCGVFVCVQSDVARVDAFTVLRIRFNMLTHCLEHDFPFSGRTQ